MEIIKKRIICDRCHKELDKNDYTTVCDDINGCWSDLCESCHSMYLEYKEQIEELWKKQDEITKEYKFGKHLPKYEEMEKE